MNVFMNYLCSERFSYDDEEFRKITDSFDFIFEDINNGHPTDFLPRLAPFFKSYHKQIHHHASAVRTFILEKIIKDRVSNFNPDKIDDLVDALLANYKVTTN